MFDPPLTLHGFFMCSGLCRGGRGAYFLFGCNHHGHQRADFEIQDETSLPMAFNMFKGLALRLNGI